MNLFDLVRIRPPGAALAAFPFGANETSNVELAVSNRRSDSLYVGRKRAVARKPLDVRANLCASSLRSASCAQRGAILKPFRRSQKLYRNYML